MDFQQVNPQNLEAIFSQNPGVWGMAQDYMARANQGNDLSQQHQQLANQYDEQSMPGRLQKLDLENQTSQAQLPGLQATSAMQARKNSNEEALNPQYLDSMKGKYGQEKFDRYLKGVSDVGDLYSQMAGIVANNPVGAIPKIKQVLEDSGHSDMWNPQWEKSSPEALYQQLSDLGGLIQRNTSAYLQKTAPATMRYDQAVTTTGMNIASKEKLAADRNALAESMQAKMIELKKALDKPGMQQLAGRMANLAQQARDAGDLENAQKYADLANQYMDQVRSIPVQGAATPKESTVDINTLTGGAVPTTGAPTVPKLGQPAQATPKPQNNMKLVYKSPEGQAWIKAAMARNPGVSEEEVIMEGRKSGRLVD